MFICSSLGSFLINVTSLLFNLRAILTFHESKKGQKAWSPGYIFVCTVSTENALGDFYLILIWSAHLHLHEYFKVKDEM